MNIAVIGSGGREHALCWKIAQSPLTKKLYSIPGNGGTKEIAENIDIDLNNFQKIYTFIKQKSVNLVIVGPEEPLVNGLVDFLIKKKVNVFGPNKKAAQLEGSKIFVKNLCKLKKIPTANFKVCYSLKDIKKNIKFFSFPVVVKADGLASGKGVFICKNYKILISSAKKIFNGEFKGTKKLVLEEFINGEELSYFLIVDKYSFKFFGSAQDHKRAGEKETGPNTGGMGAYSPSLLLNKSLEKKIITKIVTPTLKYLKEKKIIYRGFLYVGLMIKNNKPYLIEYNVRMGDPECQVILPLLKSDLVKTIQCAIKNQLFKTKIVWKKKKSMTIVLCSKGYPGKFKKGIEIQSLEKIKNINSTLIFHSGTKFNHGSYYNNGGRVLNIASIGSNFLKIRNKIIDTLKILNWKNGFYRKDIGWRIFKN